MMKITRTKLWLLCLLFMILTLTTLSETLAIFETNASGDIESEVAKWIIRLNDILISDTEEQTINISTFNYTENTNVADGYIAPGRSGYFDLVLDPTGTEVSIKYTITIDEIENLGENIDFNIDVPEGSTITRNESGAFVGIITKDEIDGTSNISLRINLIWTDDSDYNEIDTEQGLIMNNKISIPVNIKVEQYFGESLE